MTSINKAKTDQKKRKKEENTLFIQADIKWPRERKGMNPTRSHSYSKRKKKTKKQKTVHEDEK